MRRIARHRSVLHRPPKASAVKGLLDALAVLHGATEPMSSEEILAERERHRLDMEARHSAQGQLPLQVR